jgi:hypothetical protein
MEESDHDDAIEWALGDIKYDYHEHLALAAKKFGGAGGATRKEDSSFFLKKLKRLPKRLLKINPKRQVKRLF